VGNQEGGRLGSLLESLGSQESPESFGSQGRQMTPLERPGTPLEGCPKVSMQEVQEGLNWSCHRWLGLFLLFRPWEW
jgi:hypothetical protein